MADSIFQHFIFQEFILPFLLIFAIVFAVLEKTEVLGKGKKTINAIIAFVAGLVFVTAIFPKSVVTNLVLFLSVALIVVFVVMLLWSFIIGDAKTDFNPKIMKWALIIGIGVGLLFLIIWTVRVQTGFLDWISDREWSGPFWTNIVFVITIAIALALVLKNTAEKSS